MILGFEMASSLILTQTGRDIHYPCPAGSMLQAGMICLVSFAPYGIVFDEIKM